VSFTDIKLAERQGNAEKVANYHAIREERYELMARLADLPGDMNFFTQITMEAAEDLEFLAAMKKARIRGALVGVEAVTPEGLKEVYKDLTTPARSWCSGCRRSAITASMCWVRLSSAWLGRQITFEATQALARRAKLTFAQFVMLTPFPARWTLTSGRRASPAIRPWWRDSDHPLLADSGAQAAEDVYAAPDDELRGAAAADAGCVGRVL
jgi:hypothetical protein